MYSHLILRAYLQAVLKKLLTVCTSQAIFPTANMCYESYNARRQLCTQVALCQFHGGQS